MLSRLYWCWMCGVCERAYLSYAQGVAILESSADPIEEFEGRPHQGWQFEVSNTEEIKSYQVTNILSRLSSTW